MTGRFEHFDARPGGSYRLVLAFADASGRAGSPPSTPTWSTPWEVTPSTPDQASTSGPTMCPTGSTLQITRRDCRPRWTISPLPLNAERRLSRSTVLVATATDDARVAALAELAAGRVRAAARDERAAAHLKRALEQLAGLDLPLEAAGAQLALAAEVAADAPAAAAAEARMALTAFERLGATRDVDAAAGISSRRATTWRRAPRSPAGTRATSWRAPHRTRGRVQPPDHQPLPWGEDRGGVGAHRQLGLLHQVGALPDMAEA
jgi:hypothetical protein